MHINHEIKITINEELSEFTAQTKFDRAIVVFTQTQKLLFKHFGFIA